MPGGRHHTSRRLSTLRVGPLLVSVSALHTILAPAVAAPPADRTYSTRQLPATLRPKFAAIVEMSRMDRGVAVYVEHGRLDSEGGGQSQELVQTAAPHKLFV